MASPDNMTTVAAAPTVPKPTPAGSGLTAGEWAGIGIGIIGLILTLIGMILGLLRYLHGDNVIERRRERRTKDRRRHSRRMDENSEQETPRTSMPTASTDRPRRSRSRGDDSEQGIPLTSMPTGTSRSSARQQQPGRSTTQETRDDPAQLAAAEKCQKKLKEIYSSTGSYVQMLPWVDNDKRHIMDIYTKLQLRKDGNDLEGEVKSYWDIFKLKTREGHTIIRAISRGWAGLGKTTLINKIAYDWACGSVAALKRYKLVFVLKMHSLQQNSDVIDALFDQLLEEKNINREDLQSFITANPEDVLFLLDGFDEFKSTELDETKFGSILKMLNRKEEYQTCSVLVTTRPSHYDKLVKNTLIEKPFALVDVLGFSKGDIKDYVDKFYSEEQPKANGLLERITSSGVLSDLAKSPMLLLLMCLLWKDNATLPDTMFRLYNQALLYIFKRKTHMSTEEISRLVIAIGKVAFDGLLSGQKLSFLETDFEPDVLDKAIRAGILTSQRVLKGIVTSERVHFIHKTFHEFCAAVYYQSITLKVETQKFETYFRQLSDTAGFEYLLRFCCGDNDGPSTNLILNVLSHKVKGAGNLDDTNLQIALNCYFESQSQTFPPMELINSVIASDVHTSKDLSRDFSTSLMYFLKNVTDEKRGDNTACLKKIHSLRISGTTLRRLGADFVNHVNRMASLHEIDVSTDIVEFTQESQNDWSRLISSLRLKKMRQLNTVRFDGCLPTRSDMEHIIGEISDLPNLVELDLSHNETLAGSGRSWSHLGKIKTLNKLNLKSCRLKSDDLKPIAVWLSDLPNPVKLDLYGNMTLAGSGRAWSHLGEIKTLNKLSLGYCGLKSDDLEPIAVGLSNLLNLVELNLSGNENFAGSGRSWSHLRKIKSLNKLDLIGCGLKSDDLKPIAVGLSELTKRVELDLSGNETLIGSGTSWHHLNKIKSLNKLNLGYCTFGSDDLKPIAFGLKNLTVVELDLGGNYAVAGSDRALSYLREIKTLKKLRLTLD